MLFVQNKGHFHPLFSKIVGMELFGNLSGSEPQQSDA
jgi:hypothetical protein